MPHLENKPVIRTNGGGRAIVFDPTKQTLTTEKLNRLSGSLVVEMANIDDYSANLYGRL